MSDIAAIEHHKAEAQQIVQQRNDLLELVKNPLFKRLILDGYCNEEMRRLMSLSVAPNLSQQDRDDALMMAKGAACLRNFLRFIEKQGDQAESDIKKADDTHDELRAQEA